MLPESSTISLIGLISGLSPIILLLLQSFIKINNFFISFGLSFGIVLLSYLFVISLYPKHDNFNKSNFLSALLLGFIATFAVVLILKLPYHFIFGIYLIQLCLFHWSEFFVTSIKNPKGIKIDFYMLNHSTEYILALIFSVVEYWLEKTYFSTFFLKYQWLTFLGLAISILGEVLRKISLWTAGTNFNHYVEYEKRQDHLLVTHGVYKWFRHPSYVGWFYFSIGTQIALLNPVCFVGYSIASWKFFSDRIYQEEKGLIRFFGSDYIAYQLAVGTGLPFIKGYV